jgi:hypothetical protein
LVFTNILGHCRNASCIAPKQPTLHFLRNRGSTRVLFFVVRSTRTVLDLAYRYGYYQVIFKGDRRTSVPVRTGSDIHCSKWKIGRENGCAGCRAPVLVLLFYFIITVYRVWKVPFFRKKTLFIAAMCDCDHFCVWS